MTTASNFKLVGISLVRNEDRFIQQAVRNVAPFCDDYILADHMSEDRTWEICQELREEFPQIRAHRIEHSRQSHDFIKDYAGTPTWILGVDGDELYEPSGIQWIRSELESGRFNNYWAVKGHVLNCTELDEVQKTARGFLAPPSRPITKLMNFGALHSWTGCERQYAHDGVRVFKSDRYREPGPEDYYRKYELGEDSDWDQARFRCLHLCFLSRSSRDALHLTRTSPMEANPAQLDYRHLARPSWWRQLTSRFFKTPPKDWKHEWYARGELVSKPVYSFLSHHVTTS